MSYEPETLRDLSGEEEWEDCVDLLGRPCQRPSMKLPEGARVINADQIPENTVLYAKETGVHSIDELPFVMVSIYSLRARSAARL